MVELNESENTERVALQMEMLLRLLVVFAKHFPFLNLQIIGEILQKTVQMQVHEFLRVSKKNKKIVVRKTTLYLGPLSQNWRIQHIVWTQIAIGNTDFLYL